MNQIKASIDTSADTDRETYINIDTNYNDDTKYQTLKRAVL